MSQSHAHSHDNMLPKGALVIAGSLVLFALGATVTARLVGMPPAASPAALRASEGVAAVRTLTLRFADRADGGVNITDINSGRIVGTIEPGAETGFIRAVMRGMARDRKKRGIGDQPPFVLTEWRDGQLSLTDTATGTSTELTAFGTDNRASFAALFSASEGKK